jgi:hypothetical protein
MLDVWDTLYYKCLSQCLHALDFGDNTRLASDDFQEHKNIGLPTHNATVSSAFFSSHVSLTQAVQDNLPNRNVT